MPALDPTTAPKVLVIGANGFIASHIVRGLLEHGYHVRGTVRSSSKISHLQRTFASFGDALELVVIPDITAVRPSYVL